MQINNYLKTLVTVSGLIFAIACCAKTSTVTPLQQEKIANFIKLATQKTPYSKEELNTIFAEITLHNWIIETMQKPAEKTMTWSRYKKIFINKERLKAGLKFINEHADTLNRVAKQYQVDKYVIAAIIGVETYFGKIKGKHKVIDTLSTLSFIDFRRNKFFQSELIHFLNFAYKNNTDVFSYKGSYAGAMGYGQFMPSSINNYAVDADQDNIIDLYNNPKDAIASVANYLAKHRWHIDKEVAIKLMPKPKFILPKQSIKPYTSLQKIYDAGFTSHRKDINPKLAASIITLDGNQGIEYWAVLDNFYVISRYNPSKLYSMAVYSLSRILRTGKIQS